MVVGNGMLAKSFLKEYVHDKSVYIFASGVSNSQETDFREFEREQKLLEETLKEVKDGVLVYFSTCSVYQHGQTSSYIEHKLKMEALVKNSGIAYYIFRLPQVAGKTEKKIFFISYIFSKIATGESFEVWNNSSRNVIDIDDIVKISKYILDKGICRNEIINIATPYNVPVLDYVRQIEMILDKKAVYEVRNKGSKQNIDITVIASLIDEAGVDFLNQKEYLDKVIKKYYF